MAEEEITNKVKNIKKEDGVTEEKKIKTEDGAAAENHFHKFILKFHNSENEFTIVCERPQTVLEAIKAKMDLECDDQKLTLQIKRASTPTAIATHFPCSLLRNDEVVTVTSTSEQVEDGGTFDRSVLPNERYYVVFIETKGGINAKTKPLFRSSAIKDFTRLCVYGTEDMTIRDAITRDGRFNELGDGFKLSKGKSYVFSHDKIKAHNKETFRICFEKMAKGKNTKLDKQSPEQKAGETSQAVAKVQPKIAETKGNSLCDVVRKLEGKGKDKDEVKKIYQLLREQFGSLRKIMLDRCSDVPFEKKVQKVDFGKAQQSFSDVFRLEKLFKLGKSVCKLVVGDACVGTAFVLFHHYILTNAHLFKGLVSDNILDPTVKVNAFFNYKTPDHQNTLDFAVQSNLIDFDEEQDYAVLKLEVSDQDKNKVPPGLMRHFGPMPESGEACIIGHPGGNVLSVDPTCIIEKHLRKKEHLEQLDLFAHMSVSHLIKKQNIDRILSQSDPLAQSVGTYHTFMYHGSSGSPVFDAHCRVFGLHSGGFIYGLPPETHSVIEFSHPVILIVVKFITSLKRKNQEELLGLVKEHAERNHHLIKILGNLLSEEPMDTRGF